MNNENTIFIGVGNCFRRDDGAGIFAVRQLKKRLSQNAHYCFTEASGEGARLMALWEGYDEVVIFDAIMRQGCPGCVTRMIAASTQFPSDFFKYSSHAFSLAEAVELARILNKLPNKLTVFGVEGADFGYGEELSVEVKKGCDEIIERVILELNQTQIL